MHLPLRLLVDIFILAVGATLTYMLGAKNGQTIQQAVTIGAMVSLRLWERRKQRRAGQKANRHEKQQRRRRLRQAERERQESKQRVEEEKRRAGEEKERAEKESQHNKGLEQSMRDLIASGVDFTTLTHENDQD